MELESTWVEAPLLHSESQDKLIQALIKFQGSIGTVAKSKDNPYFGSKYADLGAIFNEIRKPLADNGLCVIQEPLETNGDVVRLQTTIFHESGQFRSSILAVRPAKSDPQGIGSAITYARRYSLSPMLGIVTEEDDDGNAASHGGNGNGKSAPAQQQKTQGSGKSATASKSAPKEQTAQPAPQSNGETKHKSELTLRKEAVWKKILGFAQGDELKAKRILGAKTTKPSKEWTQDDVVQLEGYAQDIIDGTIVADPPESGDGL